MCTVIGMPVNVPAFRESRPKHSLCREALLRAKAAERIASISYGKAWDSRHCCYRHLNQTLIHSAQRMTVFRFERGHVGAMMPAIGFASCCEWSSMVGEVGQLLARIVVCF